MNRRRIVVALAVCTMAPGRSTAQNAELKPYTIPPSPAFSFLGTTPGTVERPTSARAFAAGLVQDFRTAGGIPRGLAVDVAPWAFVPGLRIPLRTYQTNRGAYILANTQVSVGSIQAKGDSADTDVATGLRMTLYDRGDPMTDTAYTNAVRTGLARCQTEQPTVADSVLQACARQVTTQLRTKWREAHWNAASLAVAAAGGWRFRQSKANDSEWLGLAGWATAAAPLFRGGQLLGQLRYDTRSGGREGFSYGGRAYFGTPTLNIFAELTRDAVQDSVHPTSWAGGVEFRALQSFWISTGVGTVAPPGSDSKKVAVIANLRWDVSTTPRFGRLLP